MDIAVHPKTGAVYVATRNEILRLWDRDGNGVADKGKIERRLVFLDTKGNYPHNGISGLSFDPEGNLYAAGSVNCNKVTGNVDAGGSVQCGDVGSYVNAGGSVKCKTVKGNVDAGGSVRGV